MSKFINIENNIFNKNDIAYAIYNTDDLRINIIDKYNKTYTIEDLNPDLLEKYIDILLNKCNLYDFNKEICLNLNLVSSIRLHKHFSTKDWVAEITWRTKEDLPKLIILNKNIYSDDSIQEIIEEILKYD